MTGSPSFCCIHRAGTSVMMSCCSSLHLHLKFAEATVSYLNLAPMFVVEVVLCLFYILLSTPQKCPKEVFLSHFAGLSKGSRGVINILAPHPCNVLCEWCTKKQEKLKLWLRDTYTVFLSVLFLTMSQGESYWLALISAAPIFRHQQNTDQSETGGSNFSVAVIILKANHFCRK